MAMRGRKPTPTDLKILRGNPGRRPLNQHEPQLPPAELEEIPAELTDDRSKAEWQRLAPMLRKARQITEAERASLIALCLQWSTYLECTARLAEEGMLTRAPSGYPMPNPYIGIANKALSHCTKLWAELGLTPSSRSRVSTAVPSAEPSNATDERERYFNRG